MIKLINVLIQTERRDAEVLEATGLKSSLRRVVGAKAALYTDGDEMKLIEAAVRAYVSDVPDGKCLCGGKTKLQFRDREMTVFAASEPTTVSVKNAPVFICESCGEEYYSLNVDVFLEREIEEDILRNLRTRKEPITEFDFLRDFLNST